MRYIDLSGQTLGSLIVLKKIKKEGQTAAFWLCKCKCGNEAIKSSFYLRTSTSLHCGCGKIEHPKKKITIKKGTKFTRWTVVETSNERKLKCICDCGKEKVVNKQNLMSGKSKSCGCLTKEVNKKRLSTKAVLNEKLYLVYLSMKNRCYRPEVKSYKHYGLKGITVCEEWKNNYDTFYDWAIENGYEEGLTLDRNDVKGNYEPDNCSWETRTTQARNKTNNVMVTIRGITKNASEWDEVLGFEASITAARIRKGWSGDELLLPPSWKRREDRWNEVNQLLKSPKLSQLFNQK